MKALTLAALLLSLPLAGSESAAPWRSNAGTEIKAEIEAVDWDQITLRDDQGRLLDVEVKALVPEDQARARAFFKEDNPLSLVTFGQPLFDHFLIYNWFEPATKKGGWQSTYKSIVDREGDFDTQRLPLMAKDLEGVAPRSKRRFLLVEVDPAELGGGNAHLKVVKRLSEIQKTCSSLGFTPLIVDPYYETEEYGESGKTISKTRLSKLQVAVRGDIDGWITVPVRSVIEAMIDSSDAGADLAKDRNSLNLIVFGVLFSSVTDEAVPLDQWNPYAPHPADPFAKEKSVLDGMGDDDLRAFGEKILDLTRKHSRES